MTRLALWFAFVLLFCGITLAEIRTAPSAEIGGIAIVIFPGLNKQILVSIHSDFSRETRIDLPLAEAASFLKDFPRQSPGGILVRLEAKGVELEHYFASLEAIARNRNLSLSFVNGAAGIQPGSGARPKFRRQAPVHIRTHPTHRNSSPPLGPTNVPGRRWPIFGARGCCLPKPVN